MDPALGVEAKGGGCIVLDPEHLMRASAKAWHPSDGNGIAGSADHGHLGGGIGTAGHVEGDLLVRHSHRVPSRTFIDAVVRRVDVEHVELALPGERVDHPVLHLVLAPPRQLPGLPAPGEGDVGAALGAT